MFRRSPPALCTGGRHCLDTERLIGSRVLAERLRSPRVQSRSEVGVQTMADSGDRRRSYWVARTFEKKRVYCFCGTRRISRRLCARGHCVVLISRGEIAHWRMNASSVCFVDRYIAPAAVPRAHAPISLSLSLSLGLRRKSPARNLY